MLLPLPLVPNCRVGHGVFSSSARLTPLSFHGLRSALKLLVDSIEIREDLDTLLDPNLNREPPGECELFFRLSRKDEIDDMLPGFRSLSKMVLLSRVTSSPNEVLVGESVFKGAC